MSGLPGIDLQENGELLCRVDVACYHASTASIFSENEQTALKFTMKMVEHDIIPMIFRLYVKL